MHARTALDVSFSTFEHTLTHIVYSAVLLLLLCTSFRPPKWQAVTARADQNTPRCPPVFPLIVAFLVSRHDLYARILGSTHFTRVRLRGRERRDIFSGIRRTLFCNYLALHRLPRRPKRRQAAPHKRGCGRRCCNRRWSRALHLLRLPCGRAGIKHPLRAG